MSNELQILIEASNERRDYLHRKLFDLIHDCQIIGMGLHKAGLTTFAAALAEAVERAKPEGR